MANCHNQTQTNMHKIWSRVASRARAFFLWKSSEAGWGGETLSTKALCIDVEMVNRIYSGFDGCDVKLSDNLDIM